MYITNDRKEVTNMSVKRKDDIYNASFIRLALDLKGLQIKDILEVLNANKPTQGKLYQSSVSKLINGHRKPQAWELDVITQFLLSE